MYEKENMNDVAAAVENLKDVKRVDDGSDIQAQNALLESILQLANSDDPKDAELYEELTRRFTHKMEKFAENLKALPRAQRRKFKGYNSFSKQFKASIGL